MYAGSVVEFGPVKEIFHNPKHPYTRRLIECDPAQMIDRAPILPTIPGEIPDLTNLPAGCVFCDRCTVSLPRCADAAPTLDPLDAHHHAACWLNLEEKA